MEDHRRCDVEEEIEQPSARKDGDVLPRRSLAAYVVLRVAAEQQSQIQRHAARVQQGQGGFFPMDFNSGRLGKDQMAVFMDKDGTRIEDEPRGKGGDE